MARERETFFMLFVLLPAALSVVSLITPGVYVYALSCVVGVCVLSLFFISLKLFPATFFIHANLFFLAFFFFFPAVFLTDVVYWSGGTTSNLISTGPISIACIWMTASSLGYGAARKSLTVKTARRPVQGIANELRGGELFLPILLGLLVIYFASSPSRFLTDRYHSQWAFVANIYARSQSMIFVEMLPRCMAFAVFAASAVLAYRSRTATKCVIMVVAALVWFAFNNPISTPREIILSQLLVLVVLFGVARAWSMSLWIGMIFVLFFVGPVVSFFSREYSYKGSLSFFNGADFDVYQNSVAFWRYISDHGPTYGTAIVRDLSFWLPAEFKPNVPDLTIAVAKYSGYLQMNISMPIFNDLYADLGFFGLTFLSFACGYGLGRCEESFYGIARAGAPTRMAMIYIVASSLAILRGPLIGTLPYVALGAASMFAVSFLSLGLKLGPLKKERALSFLERNPSRRVPPTIRVLRTLTMSRHAGLEVDPGTSERKDSGESRSSGPS